MRKSLKNYMMDHIPIFGSGFHDVSFSGVKETLTQLLVKPFADSQRRKLLLDHLVALLREVANVSIFTEAWIDGSFVTDKEAPNDVDVVLWYNATSSVSPRELQVYRELQDAKQMMSRYNCDVYLVKNGSDKLRRYWEGWFGQDRTGCPKGMIRVVF